MSKIRLLTGIRMIATIVVILVVPVPTTVFAQIKIDPSQRIVLVVDEYKAIRNFPLIVAERLGFLRSEKFDVTVVNVIAITANTANTLIRVFLGIFLLFIRFRRLV